MQDADLISDWADVASTCPDFLFISLGGNLSEAVNPPGELFSCGVVLAPGFRPPDIFDYLHQCSTENENGNSRQRQQAISRIVQAAGRLQRSPQHLKPVLLLNKSFARKDFLQSFPRTWYQRKPEELLFETLKDAQTYFSQARHAG